LASNNTPIDLNNIFISSNDPLGMIDFAHENLLPRNLCNWIKGLYSVAIRDKNINEIVSVVSGDCSNTHALTELFVESGIKIYRFSYPTHSEDKYQSLHNEITNLARSFSLTLSDVIEYSKITDKIRSKLRTIDQLTVEGKVTGFENHLWLVSSSDFNSDIDLFSKNIDEFIYEVKYRPMIKNTLRLGFIGVPPIMPSIYPFLADRGANIIFNEVQRQFSIPSLSEDYIQRYLDYTYPYSIWDRIDDIKKEIKNRKLDALIHYVQSFCFRQMQDIVLKKHIDIPILTIEGDKPLELDNRTAIRIESFLEMLTDKKLG